MVDVALLVCMFAQSVSSQPQTQQHDILTDAVFKYGSPAILAGVLVWLGKLMNKVVDRMIRSFDKIDDRLDEMTVSHHERISDLKRNMIDLAGANRQSFANALTHLIQALYYRDVKMTKESLEKARDALDEPLPDTTPRHPPQ